MSFLPAVSMREELCILLPRKQERSCRPFLTGDQFEAWTAASSGTICLEMICSVPLQRDPGGRSQYNELPLKRKMDKTLALRLPDTVQPKQLVL